LWDTAEYPSQVEGLRWSTGDINGLQGGSATSALPIRHKSESNLHRHRVFRGAGGLYGDGWCFSMVISGPLGEGQDGLANARLKVHYSS
jgi:hypothetical protein